MFFSSGQKFQNFFIKMEHGTDGCSIIPILSIRSIKNVKILSKKKIRKISAQKITSGDYFRFNLEETKT